MKRWPQPWRFLAYALSWVGIGLWAAAGWSFFFLGLGRPPRLFGLLLAGLSGVTGMFAFVAVALIARRLRRAGGAGQPTLDAAQQASVRRSFKWTAVGCGWLVAGLAWALFATNEWAGSRGVFLAASGVLVAVAVSSAASVPYIRAVRPARRPFGMPYVQFTFVSIIVAIACAVALAILAIAMPAGV